MRADIWFTLQLQFASRPVRRSVLVLPLPTFIPFIHFIHSSFKRNRPLKPTHGCTHGLHQVTGGVLTSTRRLLVVGAFIQRTEPWIYAVKVHNHLLSFLLKVSDNIFHMKRTTSSAGFYLCLYLVDPIESFRCPRSLTETHITWKLLKCKTFWQQYLIPPGVQCAGIQLKKCFSSFRWSLLFF